VVSTPTIEGSSRIANEFELGTKERWYVPCPACGVKSIMSFWNLSDHAYPKHKCDHCGDHTHGRNEWQATSRIGGEWRAERTHYEQGLKLTTRSFHMDCLPSPWFSWHDLKTEYAEDKSIQEDYNDFTKLITFHNTRLARLWTDASIRQLDWQQIYDRRTDYKLTPGADLPEPVLILVAGADTQDNRIEFSVYGFGEGKECYAITHEIIHGDTALPETWERFTKALYERDWVHPTRGKMRVEQILLDSGGHRATETQHWARYRAPRAYVLRGKGGKGVPVIADRNFNNEMHIMQVIVGVDSVKVDFSTRLNIETPGPGYVHYPKLPNGDPVYSQMVAAGKRSAASAG
jgi:phage terminase large subunit GpA-like protein